MLRLVAVCLQAKAFVFSSGHPDVCTAIIVIIIIIIIIIIIFFMKKIVLRTMLTIKILFTINSLKKREKNYSFKNTIYNSCRFKKHLI